MRTAIAGILMMACMGAMAQEIVTDSLLKPSAAADTGFYVPAPIPRNDAKPLLMQGSVGSLNAYLLRGPHSGVGDINALRDLPLMSLNPSITSWPGGSLYAAGSNLAYPGMMIAENMGLGAMQHFGDFTLTGSVGATHYGMIHSVTTQWGVGGSFTWKATPHLGITLYGAWYNNAPWLGPAAMPYVNSSVYGGFVSVKPQGPLGVDLGARRQYNTFTGRWEVEPIVSPFINIHGAKLQIDVGPLLRDAIFGKRHMPRNGVAGIPKPYIPIAPRR